MEEQHIPYDEIGILARTIARRIQDREKITHVIGLARGGLIPATIISYALDRPLLSYAINSYKGTKKTENLRVGQTVNFYELYETNNNLHVLVVDDICDTGDTMEHLTTKLALGNIPYTTACICTKEKHTKWLDHYGVVVPDNKWIVFPWE
tara:strand:- start:295 stop:747 length:453 start_codon:yes stop_codon:yes gene_type:complete